MTHRDKRVELPFLRDVRIASPCKESWDAMKGNDRVRFCARCEKNVFDLSEMTALEAESVLADHGGAACVRFYRRGDGTVMTSDCPDGQRRARRRNVVLAGALTAGTIAGAGALAFGGDDTKHVEHLERSVEPEAIMGGISAPPPDSIGSGSAIGTATIEEPAMGAASGAPSYFMGGSAGPPMPSR